VKGDNNMNALIIRTALILAMASAPASAFAQFIANDFVQKGSAQLSREDAAYNVGQTALNESRWSDAVTKFDQVIAAKGSRAAAAMYWRAYSLNKLGRAQDALSQISTLRRQYANTKWAGDAAALEVDITGRAPVERKSEGRSEGKGEPSACGENEDLKLLALTRLIDRDEERAVPLLEKIMGGPCKRLREKALFVLGQSENPKAIDLIGRIARGEIYPELQTKAIQQIGVVNPNPRNMQTLSVLYASSNNYEIRRTILHTFGVNGSKDLLVKAARSEKDPKLQRVAIQALGVAGAKEELRSLYKEMPSYDAKTAILDAFIVSGDSEGFADVARTEPDLKLRRQAIRGIGISGGRNTGPALVSIYKAANDKETKDAAVEGLFVSDNASSLVELARAEKDPAMKRRIVEKLSVMDNKAANDYMIEILDKQ
jgi:HEAT repeat protein